MGCQVLVSVDTYLPGCHGFIGKVFVEIEWAPILNTDKANTIIPLLLRLVVKLAAEPIVRQLGLLQSFIKNFEYLPWWIIDEKQYEAIIQWYVMSADCRVVLKHPDRHRLDAEVFR